MNLKTPDLLTELERFESELLPRAAPSLPGGWFNVIEGRIPVLVSAPHAGNHIRDGVEKMAEEFTAALAMQLAAVTGCHAIYVTHKTSEDSNWVSAGAYKGCIAELVQRYDIGLVIDLHGMTNRYHLGVALGTMHGRAAAGVELVAPFVSQGFVQLPVDEVPEPEPLVAGVPLQAGAARGELWRTLVVDHPRFTGGLRNHTVTRYACEELSIAAVQVEIAAVNRIVFRGSTADWPHEYRGNPAGIVAVVNALSELAGSV